MVDEAASSTYEVLAVRYGTRRTTKSEVYLNFGLYREPDTPVDMDYFFWLARSSERTVLIDCGFRPSVGRRRGRTTVCPPLEALVRLGLDAGRVGTLVVTHAHYDHIGNLGAFSGAEIVTSRREFEFWTGPYGARPQFAAAAEAAEIEALGSARAEDRLTLVSGEREVAPGITLLEVGGHTPGQLVVLIASSTGRVVVASDAAHYYEEVERDRPFAIVHDLEASYRALDLLRELHSDAACTMVPGHDPAVMERFPACPGDLEGLAVRIA